MRTVALMHQASTFVEHTPFSDYITIVQLVAEDEDGDEIVITKPCIREFIKALTKAADAMGA